MKSSPRSWRFIGPRAACWACKWATDDVDEQKALWQQLATGNAQLATGNWQFDSCGHWVFMSTARLMTAIILQPSPQSQSRCQCRSQHGERFESEPKPRPRPSPEPDSAPRLCPVSWQASLGINKCKTSTPWAQNCYRHRGGYLVRPSVDFDIDIDSDSDTRCDVARLDSRLASRNWNRNWSWDWDSLGGHASPKRNCTKRKRTKRTRDRKIGDSSHGSCSS